MYIFITGNILVNASLNFDAAPMTYALDVHAIDQGPGNLESTVQVLEYSVMLPFNTV